MPPLLFPVAGFISGRMPQQYLSPRMLLENLTTHPPRAVLPLKQGGLVTGLVQTVLWKHCCVTSGCQVCCCCCSSEWELLCQVLVVAYGNYFPDPGLNSGPLHWGFPGGSAVKNLPAMQEPQQMQVRSLGLEDPLEEGMATHSSVLAWKTPWTEEPGQAIVHRIPKSWTRLK